MYLIFINITWAQNCREMLGNVNQSPGRQPVNVSINWLFKTYQDTFFSLFLLEGDSTVCINLLFPDLIYLNPFYTHLFLHQWYLILAVCCNYLILHLHCRHCSAFIFLDTFPCVWWSICSSIILTFILHTCLVWAVWIWMNRMVQNFR